ncbi:MAG TPA: hypothetical protein VLV89_10980 [Candidatus Acidoferrum sp.]|nr:hypothetical protein [Candidatus Acidoferrum sp.]
MNWMLVFDVSKEGFPWKSPALLLSAALFSFLFGLYLRKRSKHESNRVHDQIGCAIGFLFSFIFLVSSAMDALYLSRERNAEIQLLGASTTQVAEGEVTNFHAMPVGGHGIESFAIKDWKFQYGSGWGSVTFNSNSNSGFLHEGAIARITFNGDKILKVEIAH